MPEYLPAVCINDWREADYEVCGKPAKWIIVTGGVGTTICEACLASAADYTTDEVILLFSLREEKLLETAGEEKVEVWRERMEEEGWEARLLERADILADIVETQWEYVDAHRP